MNQNPKLSDSIQQFNKNIYKRVTLENHSQWFSTLWYLEIKACLDIFICWLVFMKTNILIDILDIEKNWNTFHENSKRPVCHSPRPKNHESNIMYESYQSWWKLEEQFSRIN